MEPTDWTFAADGLSASVKERGAELCSLKLNGVDELIWQAGAQWPRHAPNLFPIVGKLAGDRLHHEGQDYTLTQHGFARDLDFEWLERRGNGCRQRLASSPLTRDRYPFDFIFEIEHTIADAGLNIGYRVMNPSSEDIFASVGAHPAFCWPLADGVHKTGHRIVFEKDEPAPIRRLHNGLIATQPEPSPVEARTLLLDESLFVRDAMIFDRLESTSLVYTAEGLSLQISWSGFEQLGLWMKPGADFICIEPWCGMASPENFDGPFTQKPGLFSLKPGEERFFSMRIEPIRT